MGKSVNDAVIVSACRTPIGKFRGGLSEIRSDDLLAHVFQRVLERSKVDANAIDEVFAGCANQAGEDNRNVARMSALLAGYPDAVGAVTVNRLCASGLEAVVQAFRAISLGDMQAVVAGGVESMSRAPVVMGYDTALGWRFPNPKLAERFPLESMGETAENVAERLNITREEQDLFALASHQKAVATQQHGLWNGELEPICALHKDEGPRPDTSIEKLRNLKPIFRQNGTVTAGNSSTLNDGAAALVLTSREFARTHGLQIQARIRATKSSGIDPRVMGLGPIPACHKLFYQQKLSANDIDAVELNEAFAAQSIGVIRELKLAEDRVNQWGGAIALGHPLGCSGARILCTLLSILRHSNGTLGLATLCIGVGQGLAMLIERE